MRTRLSLLLVSAGIASALWPVASQAETAPPPLEEEISNVAVLPPGGPHRLLLAGVFGSGADGQIRDGESGKQLGSVPLASLSNIAFAPDQSRIYVAETIWSKGNRGTRQDFVTVYDGLTLNLAKEIPLPGRAYMVTRRTNFSVSADGQRAYVYNFDPSASVNAVDLADGTVTAIDTPGCAHAMAWGDRGFSVICADGSIGSVDLTKPPELVRSAPFFDAESDPLFEEAAIDVAGKRGIFMSYTGGIREVALGARPAAGAAWSIQQAAGLEVARPDDLQLAWRPGGNVVMAWHKATNRLFVLMHPGGHWSQKQPGKELWVVDLATHKVTRRLPLDEPANSVAVSQDASPLIYLVTEEGSLKVLDAGDFSEKTTVPKVGRVTPIVPGM